MDQQFRQIHKAKTVFNLIVKGTEFLPQTQIIPISLQSDAVDLLYFQLLILSDYLF